MSDTFVIKAESRADQGKSASRRLRHTGKVPGILYGANAAPQMISVSHKDILRQLKVEAFYSRILTLDLDGKSEPVVLKDLHRHPVRDAIVHLDLQRIQADKVLRMHVPLHFTGGDIAPGVKTGSGLIEHHLIQVEVECLPKHLPEFLECDISHLNVNESVHLSQLKLPEGVALIELKHGNDASVVAIHLPRAAVEAEETPAAAATAAVPATAQKVPEAGKAEEGAKDAKKK